MPASLTVLGRPDCPNTAALRDVLDGARLPYAYVHLDDAPDATQAACGFTAPAVLARGVYGGPQTHVRPDPLHVVRIARDLGVRPQPA